MLKSTIPIIRSFAIFTILTAALATLAACSSPEPTSTPVPPTDTPEPTQAPPTPTSPPPTATPVPPTQTPTREPTATPTAQPTATNTPQPTATPTPKPTATPAPTATPTPVPIVLTLDGLPDSIVECGGTDAFDSAFQAVAAGSLDAAAMETVDACYSTSDLGDDLVRYFGNPESVSAATASCLKQTAEGISSPSYAISLLYGSLGLGSAESTSIGVAALDCLTPDERSQMGHGNLFGLPPSPGLANGISCVSENLEPATAFSYASSVFKALAGAEISADDALVFFDNLETSAACGFLPSSFAPVAMQLTRDDAACLIEQVGTAPLVGFFHFAPENPQPPLNMTALAPLLGALNNCDIAINLAGAQ